MWLQSEAAGHGSGNPLALPLTRDPDGLLCSDRAPLIPMLTDRSVSVGERAARFHASLAATLVDQAWRIRAADGVERVGLTGGVFQDRILAATAVAALEADGSTAELPHH